MKLTKVEDAKSAIHMAVARIEGEALQEGYNAAWVELETAVYCGEDPLRYLHAKIKAINGS
jgi:hypothetical protein